MQSAASPRDNSWAPAAPYIIPYAVFALFTLAADSLPPAWRSALYAAKVLAVGAALWHYRGVYTEIKPRLSAAVIPAAVVGILVIVAWIGLDPFYPQSSPEWSALRQGGWGALAHSDKLAGAFDPFMPGELLPPAVAIAFRLIGAVLIVPIFEELFWRSWLIRFLIKDDFHSVPMGAFTWLSFTVTVLAFGLTHHEWLAAVLCGVAFNAILYWRKDIFLCIIAHAVANAALAAWVLTHSAWQFW
jgi:uncharacterized protein